MIKKDDYGFDGSYEKALLGMCSSEADVELIQQFYKPAEGGEDGYHQQFYLDLYDRLGLNEEYISVAKKSGFTLDLVDKLVSLGRLEEALAECDKIKAKEYYESIEDRKILVLRKLGRNEEAKKILLNLVKTTGDFSYAVRLKKESDKVEFAVLYRKHNAEPQDMMVEYNRRLLVGALRRLGKKPTVKCVETGNINLDIESGRLLDNHGEEIHRFNIP